MLKRLDDFGRRHPVLMLIFVLLVAFFGTTPALIYSGQGAIVLYQAF